MKEEEIPEIKFEEFEEKGGYIRFDEKKSSFKM
jgi:hypothetical protein